MKEEFLITLGLHIALQGSVNVLLTSMAAIDFVLLLCSLLLFGLPAITDEVIRHYGNQTGFLPPAANEVLLQMVSEAQNQQLANLHRSYTYYYVCLKGTLHWHVDTIKYWFQQCDLLFFETCFTKMAYSC